MTKKILTALGTLAFVFFSLFGSMTVYASSWSGPYGNDNYANAISYCSSQGDYRLPTVSELRAGDSASEIYPLPFSDYWTNTSSSTDNSYAMFLHYNPGSFNVLGSWGLKTDTNIKTICILNTATPAPAGFFTAGSSPVSDLGVVSSSAFGTFTPYMLLFIGIYIAFLIAKKLIDVFKEMDEKDKKEMKGFKEMNERGNRMSDVIHYSEREYEADMKAQGLDPNNNNFHNSKYYTMKNGEELYDKMLARRHKRQAS